MQQKDNIKPLIPNIALANFYFTLEDYYLRSNSQMHLNNSMFCVFQTKGMLITIFQHLHKIQFLNK